MINDTLNKLQNITIGVGVTTEDIEKAEKELGVKFAPEYIRYLKRFGLLTANGLELTGLSDTERLNVVLVTKKEIELNSLIPSNMYVVENLAIDGFVALQDSSGVIYYSSPCQKPKRMFESLEKYIEETKI